MKKIFKRIFIFTFALINFIVISNVNAATITYRGAEFDVIPADRITTSTVDGVEATVVDGKVTFTVSIPADPTSWLEQESDTQTKNYVYSGVHITPPSEEATKYDALLDAENDFPYYGLTPESEIEKGKNYAVGLTNGRFAGYYVVGDRENDVLALYEGREYITVIYWYNDDNEYLGREYFVVERTNADPNAETIKRTEIDPSRISLVAGQENVTLENGVVKLGKDFTGSSIQLKIAAPSNGTTYTHFYTYGSASGETGTETTALTDGYAIVTLSIYNEKLSGIIDWYIDANTSVTFETINLTVEGETTSYQDESETIYLVSEDDAMLPMYKLIVTEVTDEEKLSNIQKSLKSNEKLLNLYDINIVDGNGEIVKLENGSYLIKIKMTEDLKKYDNYSVVYIDESGKVAETLKAKIDGEYITFTTTHLSSYGVVGLSDVENPQTYDSIVTYVVIMISAVLGIIGVATYLKTTNKKRFN